MKGFYLVEPLVALYAFSSFLIYPLVQQFVYRRLWEDLTNTTYPESDNISRCDDNANLTKYHEEVQRQASLFSLYTDLLSSIPSMVVTLALVAYSDRGGRKVAIVSPLIGTLLYTLAFLTVSYYGLSVYLLVGSSFLSSLFGGLGTFLGGCFAYVADLCEDGRQKTLRMAGLDMMIGLLAGAASIATGYFLRAAGFNWPFLTSAMCQVLNLAYAVFLLEETVKQQQQPAEGPDGSAPPPPPPPRSALKQMVYGVYALFAGTPPRSRTVLVLLLLIFTSFSFAYIGGGSLVTLYSLNKPLCWTEILIGYGSALSTTVFLVSFGGVFLLTSCGLMKLPMALAIMPFPVLRSMMSKIISKSEQGALFACLSFLESLTNNVASAVFNSVYAATVSWFPRFVFALAAGLCAVPLVFVGVVAMVGVDVPKEVTEVKEVTDSEVEPEDENSPLLR